MKYFILGLFLVFLVNSIPSVSSIGEACINNFDGRVALCAHVQDCKVSQADSLKLSRTCPDGISVCCPKALIGSTTCTVNYKGSSVAGTCAPADGHSCFQFPGVTQGTCSGSMSVCCPNSAQCVDAFGAQGTCESIPLNCKQPNTQLGPGNCGGALFTGFTCCSPQPKSCTSTLTGLKGFCRTTPCTTFPAADTGDCAAQGAAAGAVCCTDPPTCSDASTGFNGRCQAVCPQWPRQATLKALPEGSIQGTCTDATKVCCTQAPASCQDIDEVASVCKIDGQCDVNGAPLTTCANTAGTHCCTPPRPACIDDLTGNAGVCQLPACTTNTQATQSNCQDGRRNCCGAAPTPCTDTLSGLVGQCTLTNKCPGNARAIANGACRADQVCCSPAAPACTTTDIETRKGVCFLTGQCPENPTEPPAASNCGKDGQGINCCVAPKPKCTDSLTGLKGVCQRAKCAANPLAERQSDCADPTHICCTDPQTCTNPTTGQNGKCMKAGDIATACTANNAAKDAFGCLGNGGTCCVAPPEPCTDYGGQKATCTAAGQCAVNQFAKQGTCAQVAGSVCCAPIPPCKDTLGVTGKCETKAACGGQSPFAVQNDCPSNTLVCCATDPTCNDAAGQSGPCVPNGDCAQNPAATQGSCPAGGQCCTPPSQTCMPDFPNDDFPANCVPVGTACTTMDNPTQGTCPADEFICCPTVQVDDAKNGLLDSMKGSIQEIPDNNTPNKTPAKKKISMPLLIGIAIGSVFAGVILGAIVLALYNRYYTIKQQHNQNITQIAANQQQVTKQANPPTVAPVIVH